MNLSLVLSVIALSLPSLLYGLCDKVSCPDKCEWPKTKEECEECRKSLGAHETSMDDGFCWIAFGSNCDEGCFKRAEIGVGVCPGQNGATYYPATKKCWIKYKSP